MVEYRNRRPKDDWTDDERRMHSFFIKVYALAIFAALAAAGVIGLAIYYLF